ncbi:polysaccharide deacetylase family protein [Lentibacillus sediminis]|uniref:polysaccharide deacetylase family protein n=1 Tax=Lentibacillus sediminis TaxID=1940529 RepID=UPI000C1BC076|nr:polysaccharide deacetylase family protein [Lentibacillus sediminis]
MKRGLQIGALFFLLFLAACNQTEETASEPASSSTENEEEIDQQEETEDETNGEDEATEEESNKEEPETEVKETEIENEEAAEDPEPAYEVSDSWSIVPLDNANEEVVLLTIDDAPDEYGVEMAETLKELGAPAIFFVNGHFLDTLEEEEALKKIHEMGFAIGNHTYTHATLPEISQEEQREEILSLNERIEEIIGEKPSFFRAPHGANTDYAIQAAEDAGMTVMNWSFGYDWNQEYMNEEALADIMVNTELLGNGANLLMHDREWTAAALDDIVKGLRDKGYEMVDPQLIQTP